MSSAAPISTVPTVDAEPALREKAPINVDINPVPATNVDIKQTSSTSPVEPRSASEFELEDHPIDIKPKIRVSNWLNPAYTPQLH